MGWLKGLGTHQVPCDKVEQQLEKEMESVKRAMVSTFLFGLELRDHDLGILDHCARVAIIAERLGTRLGVSEADAYVLQTAARVHEMGLVAVSPELINRPGPLSPNEVEIVRAHATIGAAMTLAMHNPRVALLVGSQYADHVRLQKNLAPRDLLLAGILRVSDVMAAMTWPRPYQVPLAPEYQVERLLKGSGLRFHPDAARIGVLLADEGELQSVTK